MTRPWYADVVRRWKALLLGALAGLAFAAYAILVSHIDASLLTTWQDARQGFGRQGLATTLMLGQGLSPPAAARWIILLSFAVLGATAAFIMDYVLDLARLLWKQLTR